MVRLAQCLYDELISSFRVYTVGPILQEMAREQIEPAICHNPLPILLFQPPVLPPRRQFAAQVAGELLDGGLCLAPD